ncbi:MAG: glycosyltransferase family 2 protein [PVC group bacterium]
MPKVAIVIVTWNGKDDLLECLSSLEKIEPPRPAIIVVDNGSTDGTADAAAERFPGVEIISSPVNRGFAGGNNLGIEKALAAGAGYVCLLNNDTVADPRFLSELLKAAERHPRAGILGPRVYYRSRPDVVWSQGIAVHRLSGRIYTPFQNRPDRGLPDGGGPADAVSGAAMLLKGEMLREAGGFDEDYFLCFEDVDLCLRARQKGYLTVTVPASRVYHHVSGSMGGEHSETVVYYSTRNHLLLINRQYPLSPAGRGIRNLLIVVYTLIFAAVTAGPSRGPKIRAWRRGLLDYCRGRYGERTG